MHLLWQDRVQIARKLLQLQDQQASEGVLCH